MKHSKGEKAMSEEEEYSYREISRIKKRSVGAVIKRVNRSLEFMKSAM